MEETYTGHLKCATCGSDSQFESNEDKTYIKCNNCNREYLGGYDELLELNRDSIKDEVGHVIAKDIQAELTNVFKQAFKGNKNIKIK
ncbi:MAG: hypothetical protein WC679_04460 [Bacteroidales bacterium]|jgi:DNA-directed RNA polymerase subunit RPC12/RpoP